LFFGYPILKHLLLVNEQGEIIMGVWDGLNLKFIFRRIVNSDTMNQWLEILQIASGLQFSDDEDAIVWQYNSLGKYNVQTLYVIVNDRG
jgi:hypothetical protein